MAMALAPLLRFPSRTPRHRQLFCSSSRASAAGLHHGHGHGDDDDDDGGGTSSCVSTATTPLVQALASCASQAPVASFHFPGHRRGAAAPPTLACLLGLAPFAHDLPELPELDNLFDPQDAIARAQSQAATLFGADSTFFLINGSTCGIHAAIMSTCSPGQTLILPRNCHISAISAMVLSGAKPKYLMPSYDAEWDIAHGIDPSDVEQAFVEVEQQQDEGSCSKIGAVLIISPTYYGVCSDVRSIAHICHRRKVPLIVDEAHGAHFRFHAELPETALQQGADITIQSTHKVLSSFTQSAMLHMQGDMVDRDFLAKCLQTLQSSSPSYLLLASLDAAREQASADGGAAFTAALKFAKEATKALQQVAGVRVLSLTSIQSRNLRGALAMDPLRITVGLWDLGLSGFEADDILRLEHQVVAELPSMRSVTFAISLGTTGQDIHTLIAAFEAIAKSRSVSSPTATDSSIKERSLASVFSIVQSSLIPREAFFAATERVNAEAACGRVCGELICPYPPGIPVLVPGEVISHKAIDYLRAVVEQGGFISGASDGSIDTFMVCKEQH